MKCLHIGMFQLSVAHEYLQAEGVPQRQVMSGLLE